ncbi:hypothetical protein CY0110_15747 [Crocosphaera chwakensis CCY0110]|uniref:Uncharacterized protein n=1 Tax=Crocosphaera chwakensis CCY0110 TaxID=391612 RepID=A3IHI1_9CHRO|nr:hypothetical protein CY0110_15747 [Crocosphaera chwakensis CCY0110]
MILIFCSWRGHFKNNLRNLFFFPDFIIISSPWFHVKNNHNIRRNSHSGKSLTVIHKLIR